MDVSTRSRGALVVALLLAAGPAQAQIGEGWVEYHPGSTIQLDGSGGIETSPGSTGSVRNEGATFTRAGGIETFVLFAPISNRSERRLLNTYRSGRRQFEGEVRVSRPTNDQSVMQIFGGITPATTQMIRVYAAGGGSLRKLPGGTVLADDVYGRWIRINVIHDVGANTVRTYVNGTLRATGSGEAPSTWYHKYGCYGSLATDRAKVEWRNVRHFRSVGATSQAEETGGPVAEPEHPEPTGDPPPLSGEPAAPDPAQVASVGCAAGGRAGAAAQFVLALLAGWLLRRRPEA